MKSKIFNMFTTKNIGTGMAFASTVAGAGAFSIYHEREKIKRFQKENPGQEFDVVHRHVPNTAGYDEPVVRMKK